MNLNESWVFFVLLIYFWLFATSGIKGMKMIGSVAKNVAGDVAKSALKTGTSELSKVADTQIKQVISGDSGHKQSKQQTSEGGASPQSGNKPQTGGVDPLPKEQQSDIQPSDSPLFMSDEEYAKRKETDELQDDEKEIFISVDRQLEKVQLSDLHFYILEYKMFCPENSKITSKLREKIAESFSTKYSADKKLRRAIKRAFRYEFFINSIPYLIMYTIAKTDNDDLLYLVFESEIAFPTGCGYFVQKLLSTGNVWLCETLRAFLVNYYSDPCIRRSLITALERCRKKEIMLFYRDVFPIEEQSKAPEFLYMLLNSGNSKLSGVSDKLVNRQVAKPPSSDDTLKCFKKNKKKSRNCDKDSD